MSYNTLWTVPDSLWLLIVRLLPPEKQPGTPGRPALPHRQVVNGILYVLRTGCQWNHIPRVYGDDSTIHRCFEYWCEVGLFKKLWAQLVKECDELNGVQWKWQAADCMLGKARFGGARLAPTPRIVGKMAPKRAW